VKRSVICFTASFPYSKGEETFFGKELIFLAQKFDIVYIQPLYNPSGSEKQWPYPRNVVCWDPITRNKFNRILRGVFNLSPLKPFLNDFFRCKVYLSFDRFLRWFHTLILFRILYAVVTEKTHSIEKPITLYAYWGSTALIFPTEFFKQYRKIVRMHGGDYYLYRNNDYLPIRQEIYASADLLAPISLNIVEDLKKTYKVNANKVRIARLGISNDSTQCSLKGSGIIKIVSCSNLISLKRVHLIAESLLGIRTDRILEWHHFGEGEEYDNVVNITKNFPVNVKAIFHGWISNEELFAFYEQNYITWFLNVSIYEGIPVSIMEAFSFGIPAIATDVGGTSEIVNKNNGYILEADIDPNLIAQLILDCSSTQYFLKRKRAYETWKRNYDADSNYTDFAAQLIDLC
jgi:glycosyltransferase involved in cell wall biosynthesis